LVRVLEVDIMVARYRIDLAPLRQGQDEAFAYLVEGGKVHELPAIKQITQVKHGVDLVFLKVRQEHILNEIKEVMKEDR